MHGELGEKDPTHAVTSSSFRGFISSLVINGSVSFLMEGNREEMVPCLHLSGICLNGCSHSLEVGQDCVFSGTRTWLGWMSDVWSTRRLSCARLFLIPILSAQCQGRPVSCCWWMERDGVRSQTRQPLAAVPGLCMGTEVN